jgi:hypothetical protein
MIKNWQTFWSPNYIDRNTNFLKEVRADDMSHQLTGAFCVHSLTNRVGTIISIYIYNSEETFYVSSIPEGKEFWVSFEGFIHNFDLTFPKPQYVKPDNLSPEYMQYHIIKSNIQAPAVVHMSTNVFNLPADLQGQYIQWWFLNKTPHINDPGLLSGTYEAVITNDLLMQGGSFFYKNKKIILNDAWLGYISSCLTGTPTEKQDFLAVFKGDSYGANHG